MKKIACFTHHDLDGFVSLMVIKWAHPDHEIEYVTTNPIKFRTDFTTWLSKNNLDDFEIIFITDLDINQDQDLVDDPKFWIIDHHATHADGQVYEYANAIVEQYSSASKLIYKIFQEDGYKLKFTDQQKLLIILADDYDSYAKQLPASSHLNTIFWQTQNRFSVLMKQFENGFTGFTQNQKNMYKIYKKELQKIKEELEYFCNWKFKYKDVEYSIIAVFATKYINDVSDYILEEFEPDIVCIVNLETDHVSWRRHDDCTCNVGELAEELTKGGGHAFAAGGIITEEFLKFTKKLIPRKEKTLRKRREQLRGLSTIK